MTIYYLISGNSNNSNNKGSTNSGPLKDSLKASNIIPGSRYGQDLYSDIDTDEECSEVDVIGDDKGYMS